MLCLTETYTYELVDVFSYATFVDASFIKLQYA